jgi:uncharacterized protein HemX
LIYRWTIPNDDRLTKLTDSTFAIVAQNTTDGNDATLTSPAFTIDVHSTVSTTLPSSSASTQTTPTSQPTPTGLSTGAKAGIGIGVALVAVFLAIAAVALYFFRRRRKQNALLEQAVDGNTGYEKPELDGTAEKKVAELVGTEVSVEMEQPRMPPVELPEMPPVELPAD